MLFNFKKAVRYVVSSIAFFIGLSVCVAWFVRFEPILRFFSDLVYMRFNLALSILALSISFLLFDFKNQIFTKIISIFAFLISLGTLLEFLFNINLGIDQVFVYDYLNGKDSRVFWPGRMAINAAFSVFVCSIGIFLLTLKSVLSRFLLGRIFGVITSFSGLVGLLGYFFKLKVFYDWTGTGLSVIAVHAAFSFFLLGIALVFLSSEKDYERISRLNNRILYLLIISVFFGFSSQFYTKISSYKNFKSPVFSLITIFIVFAVFIVIFSRKVLKEANSAIQFRFLMENTDDAFIFSSLDGKILSSNQVAKKMLQNVLQTEDQETIFSFFPQKEFLAALERDQKSSNFSIEARLRDLEGKELFVEGKFSLAKGYSGVVEGVLCIITNVTEKKALYAERECSLREKSDFISIISHELRTPISVLKESINYLFDLEKDSEKKEVIEITKRNIDGLALFVGDIFSYQELSQGKDTSLPDLCSLNEIVQTVLENYRQRVSEKGVELVVDLEPKLPQIRIKKDQISQVIENLIDNAIKHTGKGSIRIKTSFDDKAVTFEIQDTGAGIKLEDKDRVFAPFSQANAEQTKRGAGLGLLVSSVIIRQHSGSIDFISDPGQGAKFYFTLPLTT